MINCQGIGKLWEIRELAGKVSSEDLPWGGEPIRKRALFMMIQEPRDDGPQCHGDSACLRKFDMIRAGGGNVANPGTGTCRSLILQQDFLVEILM